MKKKYTGRELAERLEQNVNTWKRWSRDFLPPDNIARMQAGYAREYSLDDAFTVFLGGHLVSKLAYSIPGAKQILKDINRWLKQIGHTPSSFYNYIPTDVHELIREYIVDIIPDYRLGKFCYLVKGRIGVERKNEHAEAQISGDIFTFIKIKGVEGFPSPERLDRKILDITTVLHSFICGFEKDKYTRTVDSRRRLRREARALAMPETRFR